MAVVFCLQDPINPSETVIVIRSLVPGGVAQRDGRLVPGDRLIFVNQENLENATVDQAIKALKGAPKGIVRIGVTKPLPFADSFSLDDEQVGSRYSFLIPDWLSDFTYEIPYSVSTN